MFNASAPNDDECDGKDTNDKRRATDDNERTLRISQIRNSLGETYLMSN